ncbi:MAG: ATP synthase subunit b [Candidatus Beckwithbacteria bacterium GW2011_GWB1_47_15]|uniref:ATP synthase subunit b n=1 Tax=Candidatus Beckwithbacteria bacterium GW2011_GWB1_47_15 TaxID=1618371 RepID=A0A0G1RUI6_9BACT|nr:MAG: F0F1-type ATP synthase subunit b, F-type H+-transporting ATPase subunit b [Candidatus Beckwithbacteria bacterium GW2011_GWC1_49_16]KKU35117.1 MAG: ATP synthase subunit b [Candidatus Beckwithbacteria bacterium GW2011_GWA1_46_30]KKU60761.1 MAG: ATP synthase subunit b [Candidatus Beckwithbacteria bacterium GW2011_GWB1_47_15]KKU71566.1 MAG: ATP synthase subunit b [Candidatus Beckwithbacteria bacterium GW2011_GWA2_47_25]KKW03481.1 MAG: ATP synthase subunit b [Candidatus Beckwithbacteria bact
MSIKWYQLLFQLVNFGVLLFILNRFLYRPIVKIIKQRNQRLTDSLKAAESNLKEKEVINQLKLKAAEEAEKEAVKIIEAAKASAKDSGKKIVEEAKDEAQRQVDKKYQLMLAKLSDQEDKIKKNVADLVVTTTSQVLKDSLSPAEQKSIIDSQIKKLEKRLKNK